MVGLDGVGKGAYIQCCAMDWMIDFVMMGEDAKEAEESWGDP